jgi:cation-transporting ATPase 13A1
MAPLVDNPQIKGAELWKPLPWHFHAYIWPFAIAWPVFLRYYLSADLYEKHIGSEEWTFVAIGTIVTFQTLAWLCTHWSVNLQTLFTATRAKSIEDAQLIKVLPIANAGTAEVCKIDRDTVSPLLSVPLLDCN